MRLSTALSFIFSLGCVASPALAGNSFEKRRAASCTNFVSANRAISECNTASAFCTNYIGRGPSTSTVYTTTATKTSTPPVITLKKTYTAKTITETSYTSTRTITASTVYVTTVVPATASATESDTATVSTTQTVTLTTSVTATTTQSQITTTTVPDITCTSAGSKRSLQQNQVRANPSCNAGGFPPAQITGACQCYLDRTTSAATTTTVTLSRSVTTQSFPTTATTTIKTVSTSTITPTSTVTNTQTLFTTTIATVTSTTITLTPSTITGATITTTVGSTTITTTSTTTTTTPVPTCDPNNSTLTYDGQDYETTCGVQFSGYELYVTDSTDIDDCTNQCQTLNNQTSITTYQTFCLAVAFNGAQCNSNCHLLGAVDSSSVSNTAAGWDSARMVSPAIGVWGDYCIDGVTQFGDLYEPPNGGGKLFQVLCGVEYAGDDITCGPIASSNQDCYNQCAATAGCLSASYYVQPAPSNGNDCCLKKTHPESAFSLKQTYQVDGLVLIHDTSDYDYTIYPNNGPYDPSAPPLGN